jgi:hypothetical protein
LEIPVAPIATGLDQLLQRDADRFSDQVDAVTGAERLEQLGPVRLGRLPSGRLTQRRLDQPAYSQCQGSGRERVARAEGGFTQPKLPPWRWSHRCGVES